MAALTSLELKFVSLVRKRILLRILVNAHPRLENLASCRFVYVNPFNGACSYVDYILAFMIR